MTEEEKAQIRFLRGQGYSYGKIAEILKLSRSTVSSYCLRHQIVTSRVETTLQIQKRVEYRICKCCGELFLANGVKNQQFCNTNCRRQYWKKEEQDTKDLKQQGLLLMTLKKELDFLGEESDEWCDKDNLILCRKPITKGGMDDGR